MFDQSVTSSFFWSKASMDDRGKSVLTRLNHRLSSSNCSILLLMDNAGCNQRI